MKTLLAALGLAACLALAGCFTSEQPLFDPAASTPVLGKGVLDVTTFENGEKPETGQMEWTPRGYLEPGKTDEGAMTFHHLPGMGLFSSWYVGQSESGKGDGYMYLLYHKQGDRLYSYDVSCSDLTPAEALQSHLVRKDDGQECVATRAQDLAQAFRILAKRKPAKSYLVAHPAKPGSRPPAPGPNP